MDGGGIQWLARPDPVSRSAVFVEGRRYAVGAHVAVARDSAVVMATVGVHGSSVCDLNVAADIVAGTREARRVLLTSSRAHAAPGVCCRRRRGHTPTPRVPATEAVALRGDPGRKSPHLAASGTAW
ncbi:hypothetical protein Ait01nite_012010 [Actinoplanes italicus]|nr:hypothetical protein Ait01nite_012010 [Actinoplanes italicus]